MDAAKCRTKEAEASAAHLVEGQQSVGFQEVAVRPVELGANNVLSGSEGARRQTKE